MEPTSSDYHHPAHIEDDTMVNAPAKEELSLHADTLLIVTDMLIGLVVEIEHEIDSTEGHNEAGDCRVGPVSVLLDTAVKAFVRSIKVTNQEDACKKQTHNPCRAHKSENRLIRQGITNHLPGTHR